MCATVIIAPLLALGCAAWTTTLAAQTATPASARVIAAPVFEGQRVRVWLDDARGTRYVGRLRSIDDSALVLRRGSGDDSVLVARSAVRRVDVSEQRSHALGALRGAGIGLGAGVTAGAILGATVLYEGDGCFLICNRGDGALVGAVVLGVPATVIGAVVGAFIPYERWVRADAVRVGLVPGPRRGAAIAVRVTF